MKVSAIQCQKCKDIIYSRAHHDFHWCSCHSVAIDGGFDYVKICGNREDFESVNYEVKATKKELYDDWNKMKDKYGVVKTKVKKPELKKIAIKTKKKVK